MTKSAFASGPAIGEVIRSALFLIDNSPSPQALRSVVEAASASR